MSNNLHAWESGAADYAAASNQDPFKLYLDDPAFLRILGNISGKRILDIGCGDGAFCRKMRDQGAKVIGADNSQSMIEFAKAADPEGTYHVADVLKELPFAKGSFDIVTAKMTLMCVSPLEWVATHAEQVLAKNGLFAVDVVHPFQPVRSTRAGQTDTYDAITDYSRETPGAIRLGGGEFPFYYRPVSQYVNELSAGDLALRHMQEVVIDEAFAQAHPAYADVANQPVSMHLLFEKS